MNETLKKIEAGTIRIENDKLILSNGELSLKELDDLLEFAGKDGIFNTMSDTIAGIGEIHAQVLELPEGEILQFCKDRILSSLPDQTDLYALGQILNAFKK